MLTRHQGTTTRAIVPCMAGSSIVDHALMLAVPRCRARTKPVIESTVATNVSVERQRNRTTVGRPGQGLSWAVTRSVSPTRSVAFVGVVLGPNKTHPTGGSSEPVVSRLQPNAASTRLAQKSTFGMVKREGIELPNARVQLRTSQIEAHAQRAQCLNRSSAATIVRWPGEELDRHFREKHPGTTAG
jgi:hypothetical protein